MEERGGRAAGGSGRRSLKSASSVQGSRSFPGKLFVQVFLVKWRKG